MTLHGNHKQKQLITAKPALQKILWEFYTQKWKKGIHKHENIEQRKNKYH
jgi:hypothetical protein